MASDPTADRDAAPAAAEGADLIARIAATSCADVTLLMAHEWVHAAKKTYAARPAPAAAPREGGEHRCVGCRSGLCEIPDARLCDDCQQGLSRDAARGEGEATP